MCPSVLSSLLGLALAWTGFNSTPAPAADAQSGVALKVLAEGFVSPLNLVPLPLPDSPGSLLVADQVGTIQVLKPDGNLSQDLFLDLRPRMVAVNQGFDERGLLGLALHPKFTSNRKLYLFYSAPRRSDRGTNVDCTSTVSEFKVAAGSPGRVDMSSERVLLQIDKPQMNHNCGRILFGPDGFLYIGTGDGGGANDNEQGHAPQGNGQDTTTLLAKLLRIDVDHGTPYGIPSDNPFADGKKGRPEIYAYGLRNPWGISFDRGGKHELFAVDVGQNLFEELNIIVKGGNYGWRLREGFHAFDPQNPNTPPENGPRTDALGQPLLDPVAEYRHPARNKLDPTQLQGISVTGGYVYRGKALPELQGKYVFADWSRTWALPDGVFFTASRSGEGAQAKWKLDQLPATTTTGAKLNAYIVALGEDSDGELYVLTNGRNSLTGQTGKVFKMVARQ